MTLQHSDTIRSAFVDSFCTVLDDCTADEARAAADLLIGLVAGLPPETPLRAAVVIERALGAVLVEAWISAQLARESDSLPFEPDPGGRTLGARTLDDLDAEISQVLHQIDARLAPRRDDAPPT